MASSRDGSPLADHGGSRMSRREDVSGERLLLGGVVDSVLMSAPLDLPESPRLFDVTAASD